MRLNNQSAKDLVRLLVAVPGQRYLLGDIPRGASLDQRVSSGPRRQRQERSSGRRSDSVDFREISFKDKTREILFHSSFFPREGDARWSSGCGGVLWLGERSRPPRVRVDDPRIQVQDYTLFRTIVPSGARGGRMKDNPILRESLDIYFAEGHGFQVYFYLLIILAPVEFFSLYIPVPRRADVERLGESI